MKHYPTPQKKNYMNHFENV